MKSFKCFVLAVLSMACWSIAAQTSAYLEQDGLLVIEIESVVEVAAGWSEEVEFENYTGSSYFRFAANNQLNYSGSDLLEYPIIYPVTRFVLIQMAKLDC